MSADWTSSFEDHWVAERKDEAPPILERQSRDQALWMLLGLDVDPVLKELLGVSPRLSESAAPVDQGSTA
jgi:hypothetical protein